MNHLDIVIPAQTDEIDRVTEDIEGILSAQEFSAEAILDVRLALEEIIVNIINHGYRGKEGSIGIRCKASPEQVSLEISDSAPAFNPLSVPEPDITLGIEERRIGGLGILFVRRVMDIVTYRYKNHRNVLTLVKIRRG
ncbi:MAG: ATP-binding protein [Methanoregula sp.]|jgi:anti-sigma regulatory factor (Ser/Thr protein kinase)